MKNQIKNSYKNGKCPDCESSINENIEDGEECLNCGHVFYSIVPCRVTLSKKTKKAVIIPKIKKNTYQPKGGGQIPDKIPDLVSGVKKKCCGGGCGCHEKS